MNNWKKPLMFLLILLLVFMLRWDTEASKTSNNEVLKWRRDRWTGELWLFVYSSKGDVSVPSALLSDLNHKEYLIREEAKKSLENKITIRKGLSISWSILFSINVLWLINETTRLKEFLHNKVRKKQENVNAGAG